MGNPGPILRVAAVSLIAGSLSGVAVAQARAQVLAQDKPDNWLKRIFQPPAASSVPAPASDTREWSGQPGASGNPLMSADAIRAAAADFGNCLEGLWPQAERRGVSRETFEHYTS